MGSQEEDHQSKVPFSSLHIQGRCYQPDLSLMVLPLIKPAWSSTCQISPLWSYFLSSYALLSWEKVTECSSHWKREYLDKLFEIILETSLVAQWLKILLAVQGTCVQSLVGDLRYHLPQGNCLCAAASERAVLRVHAPKQEKPASWDAHTSQWRVAPTCHN